MTPTERLTSIRRREESEDARKVATVIAILCGVFALGYGFALWAMVQQ